jgi:hypothetical protein
MLRRILHLLRAVRGLTPRLLRHPAPIVVARFHHFLLPAMLLVQYGLARPNHLMRLLRP